MKETNLSILKTLVSFVCIAFINNLKAQHNYVLNFSTNPSYVSLGSSVGSNIKSIEFWFNPALTINSSTSASGHTFIVRNDPTQYNEYGFYIRGTDWPAAGRGYLYFFVRKNGVLHEIKSDINIWYANKWKHVCGTIDDTEGMHLYIDGNLQANADPSGIYPTTPSSEITTFGIWGDALIRNFVGKMDEVRFWNRTLTQPEINANKCLWLNPSSDPSLVGYWKMNEGSGSTVFDATSSANHGSLNSVNFVLDSLCFTGSASINNNESLATISLYPNPMSTFAYLNLSSTLQDAHLYLYDATGKLVRTTHPVHGEQIILQRDQLPAGIYFIQVNDGAGILYHQKILIYD
jgi:hypothetical protein